MCRRRRRLWAKNCELAGLVTLRVRSFAQSLRVNSDSGAHSGDACCGGSRFGTNFGSLGGLWYLQIWDKLLQSQPAVFIPVQCEQTVSSFALEALDALHASINLLCQKIWTSLGSLSGRLSYLCSADRWSASVLVRQRARTTYQQIWDELLRSQSGVFKPVQCMQMVSSSALDTTSAFGSVTCRQIWDQFWQSQRATAHTCAARADGPLVCFGKSADGQCDLPADF